MKRLDYFWAAILVVALAVAIFGPVLAVDPDLTKSAGYAPAGGEHLLGTDGLGRDVWQRVLAGGAGLLLIAAASTAAAVILGIIFGLVMTSRSWPARLLTMALSVVLVIPSMLTMMVLIFGLGSGVGTMMIIMCATSVPFVARYTRAVAHPVLTSDYVLAARAGGDSWPTVYRREVLPNLASPLLADAGARFIGALYLVAAAGFLGFSPLGSDTDWATMVQASLEGIRLNPWASLAPALAMALITIPANLLVDRATRRVQ